MPACSSALGDIFRTHGSAITHREENGLKVGRVRGEGRLRLENASGRVAWELTTYEGAPYPVILKHGIWGENHFCKYDKA